jgi:hypothetical protein
MSLLVIYISFSENCSIHLSIYSLDYFFFGCFSWVSFSSLYILDINPLFVEYLAKSQMFYEILTVWYHHIGLFCCCCCLTKLSMHVCSYMYAAILIAYSFRSFHVMSTEVLPSKCLEA